MSSLIYEAARAHHDLHPLLSELLGVPLVKRLTPMTLEQSQRNDIFGAPTLRYRLRIMPSQLSHEILVNPFMPADISTGVFLPCSHELAHNAYAHYALHVYRHTAVKEDTLGPLALIHAEGWAEYASLHPFAELFSHEAQQIEKRKIFLCNDKEFDSQYGTLKSLPHSWGYRFFLHRYGNKYTSKNAREILEDFTNTNEETICSQVKEYLQKEQAAAKEAYSNNAKPLRSSDIDDVLSSLEKEQ